MGPMKGIALAHRLHFSNAMSASQSVFLRFLCIFCLGIGAFASADSYVLFHAPGKPVHNYDAILANLKAGDEVIFSNGDRFILKKVLGSGNATSVFETTDGKALRIPKVAGPVWVRRMKDNIISSATGPEFMELYIQGNEKISRLGIPVPELYRSLPSEYALVEKLTVHFDFTDFAWGRHGLNAAHRAKVFEELVAFARKTWRVNTVGDLGGRQVLYTHRGWLLVDHTNSVQFAATVRSSTFFKRQWYGLRGSLFLWNSEERLRLREAIEQERRAHGLPDRRLTCREFFIGLWESGS